MEQKHTTKPLRPLAPALEPNHEPNREPNHEPAGRQVSQPKKPRVGVSVACELCRRRKIRCDGQRPACSNCIGRTDQCDYRDESPLSQDAQKAVVRVLRMLSSLPAAEVIQCLELLRRESSASRILSTLSDMSRARQDPSDVSNTTRMDYDILEPSEPEAHQNLHVDGGRFDETIVDPIQNGQQADSSSQPINSRYILSLTPRGQSGKDAEEMDAAPSSHKSKISTLSSRESTMPNMNHVHETWTVVTSDMELVRHLLALYFCWEYPILAPLNKEHFLRDFESQGTGYCSSLLVNALLALACISSDQPVIHANPNNNPHPLGDQFFDEARRLLEHRANRHLLTTVQALGIMSLREASYGRDVESRYYASQSIKLALELGLNRVQDHGDKEGLAVATATFWGAFALDHLWSLLFGSMPHCSVLAQLPSKPQIVREAEVSPWLPYTETGALLQHIHAQPSNVMSVYNCFCALSELVHRLLYLLYLPVKSYTTSDLLGLYTSYLEWYDEIPNPLRLGHNSTPGVLFMHMYYHVAVIKLLQPLVNVEVAGSGISPLVVCAQAADTVQALAKTFSLLYTLRRAPSFMPQFILASATIVIDNYIAAKESNSSDSATPAAAAAAVGSSLETVSQSLASLSEIASSKPSSAEALDVLRDLMTKLGDGANIGVSEAEIQHPYK